MKRVISNIGFLLFLLSCHSSQKIMTRDLNQQCVLNDILDSGSILLVKIPYNSKDSTQRITATMQKYFKGHFEIVSKKTSLNDNYLDERKYRFILEVANSKESFLYEHYPWRIGNLQNPRIHLFILDRVKSHTLYDTGL